MDELIHESDRRLVIEYVLRGYSTRYINLLTNVRAYHIEQIRKQIEKVKA